MLPCLPRPHTAADYIPATARNVPTKFGGGDLTHIPIDIPIKAICVILDIFHEIGVFLHNSKYIDDESSSPTGASHALEANMAMAQHRLGMKDGTPDTQIVSWLGEPNSNAALFE